MFDLKKKFVCETHAGQGEESETVDYSALHGTSVSLSSKGSGDSVKRGWEDCQRQCMTPRREYFSDTAGQLHIMNPQKR